MKKIMFQDRYGLTKAVLEGRKTMTRRLISENVWQQADVYRHKYYEDTLGLLPGKEALIEFSPFRPGEVVAVAQRYKDVYSDKDFGEKDQIDWEYINSFDMRNTAGFTNKLFVRADLMPHQIRILSVRVERLQDINDEDCRKEGIDYVGGYSESYYFGHGVENIRLGNSYREAFAALIDKVSGKGTFESNPWVFVYKFELVK